MTKYESKTVKNLEAAFAGESMAHIKYLYFAQICRKQGDDAAAKIFADTAAQEIQHAFGHIDLLYPQTTLSPDKCLSIAIDGETHEYTEMYPSFKHMAIEEGNKAAAREFKEQITESKLHADEFHKLLITAEKRFAALAKIEEKHANHFRAALNSKR